jgi:U3 small nucleolar RNA-associated protein 3
MARKRVKKGAFKKLRPLNRNDSKLKRWNKLSDIPLDEEDQCGAFPSRILAVPPLTCSQVHASRDKILLEGDNGGDEDEDEDDEVFALQGMSEDDEAESSEEEETWGRKKSAYYSSNAAEIESDDEEAIELEEQEAKRLQSKFRETLTDNDFGLDDPFEVAADNIDLG